MGTISSRSFSVLITSMISLELWYDRVASMKSCIVTCLVSFLAQPVLTMNRINALILGSDMFNAFFNMSFVGRSLYVIGGSSSSLCIVGRLCISISKWVYNVFILPKCIFAVFLA